MPSFRVTFLASLACCAPLAARAEALQPAPVAKLSYNEHIQPILAENCFQCHGPDSSTRKAKLRLDRFEFATAPRDDLPAITPGKPKESALIERIKSTDEDERMPPLESHKQLKPAEIVLLERWVSEGARYEEHWSLIPPKRPAVPPFGRGWARNDIDPFIAEKGVEAGLKPSKEEHPLRLLRRLTLDLTGLPPTKAEIDTFLRDRSPDPYGAMVDYLLATDAAAEHFARWWLDAVRYGDTHGIHIDNYRTIWPYRDWVVNAFRQNMRFDQFTIEQLAGDLLPNPTYDQRIASGYNRCLPTTSEGGAIPAEYEAIYAKDQVETMSAVWLGLTTGCASCHDHKFDPITQKDFYSLTAFFRNSTMPAMDGNAFDTAPNLFIPDHADRDRWPKLEEEIALAQAALATRGKSAEEEFQKWLARGEPLKAPPLDYRVAQRWPLDQAAGPIVASVGLPLAGRPSGLSRSSRDGPAASAGPTKNAEPARLAGPFGPAPKINGADAILGEGVAMTREGQFSIGLWVRVEGTPSGTLLSSLSADDSHRGWEVFLENGRPGLYYSDKKDGLTARPVARQPLAPGRWHHLLFVYDGPARRHRFIDLYVNGGSGASTGEHRGFPADLKPSGPLRLGARHSASGAPVNGLTGGDVWVQDIRRYNYAFLVDEVSAEFASLAQLDPAFRAAPEKRTEQQTKALREHFLATVDPAAKQIAAQLDQLEAEAAAIRARGAITLVMQEKKDSEPFAHVLVRGEYTQLGQKVGAAVPAVLPPLPAGAPRNRLALAQWLVAPENPLTARVIVNRAWQQLFGTGLVESAGDFGVTGSRPSHPKLLDWLALEFQKNWDYRKLIRLMVTSATYRQTGVVRADLLEADPANRLLTRGPRYRLDAEVLRDQALRASGLLVAKLGGRPVRPYQPEGIWEEVAMKQSTTRFYEPDQGENLYRRSIYTLWKRTAPPPAMDILNAPSREVTCVRRDRTNTPLQALVTLNEPLFVEAARNLAAAALREGRNFDARLDRVTLPLLSRTFDPPERKVIKATFDAALARYRRDPASVKALLAVGASGVDPKLNAAELAAWTLVASQVMNLDEALTK